MTPDFYLRGLLRDVVEAHLVPLGRFTIGRHEFAVTPTGEIGRDSMRARFRVECLTCGKVEHENTTGPATRVVEHLEWMRP
jgi:hypothetical protein